MATSYTQGLRSSLSLGHQRHFWGSRSWRDPGRPLICPASKVHIRRSEADLGIPLSRKTRRCPSLESQNMQTRACYGHSKSQRASLDAVTTKKMTEKAPMQQSLLGVTVGLALCYALHAGQAQALEMGSDDIVLVEARADQQDLQAVPVMLENSSLSSPALTSTQFNGSPEESSSLTSTESSRNPVLEMSTDVSKNVDAESAPSEKKRRTSSTGIAAAAAAVAGVSLVATGGASAAVAGSAAAAGAVSSAGALAVPVSHAVASVAGLHVAEAVGASAVAAAAGVTSAAVAGAASGAAAVASGATAVASGATAVAAGTTAAVAGASAAVVATTTAVAGASAATTAAATSAAASAASSTALLATSIPAAVASATSAAAAVPSSAALLATSIPAAVASKAAVASSAGVASSSLASALPAIAAKSGATSAGAAIASGATSAGAAIASAGGLCTAPARAAAHAASSVIAEGGAAAVAAAEAHSAAMLTQSGLASALASSAHHFVEGGVAGAIGATAVCPIDVVKTRMQGQETKKGEKPKYANPADCLVQILKDEGPGALFLGLIPQLLGVAPEKAMKLTVNDLLMSVLEGYIPGARLWTLELFAGSGGGLAQVVFTNPMEMVKIRQQMQGPAEEGHQKKTALQIAKELGPAGLYQGSVATLLREIPSSAIFFGCYIVLKDSFPDQPFVAGCLAAAPAAFLCTPMDVVKTRMQMERKDGEEVLGFWDMTKKIAKEEGPKALFNGGLTRVLRVSPQFGITLAVYELLNHW